MTHSHDFLIDTRATERRTWVVVGITLVMMVLEVAGGWWWGSMALLADGWHMGTHALAVGVSAVAYMLSRRFAQDPRYSLGPWKIEVLGAYTSAVLLGLVALAVLVESVARLFNPQPVAYDQSLWLAVLGLVVNLVCVLVLRPPSAQSDTGHGHSHAHGHAHPHGHDVNLKAAYLHVAADAATSVLAIVALLLGKYLNWAQADPLIGLLGAALIVLWAKGLLAESARILLDREMDHPLADTVRRTLQADARTRVTDLHLSRVGGNAFACEVSLVTASGLTPADYRAQLLAETRLVHVLVEVNATPPGTATRA